MGILADMTPIFTVLMIFFIKWNSMGYPIIFDNIMVAYIPSTLAGADVLVLFPNVSTIQ